MNWTQRPRMGIVSQVLDAARDAGDRLVVDDVYLIDAHRRGWRNHHNPADWQVVKAFSAD
jgi:hypothetical protein